MSDAEKDLKPGRRPPTPKQAAMWQQMRRTEGVAATRDIYRAACAAIADAVGYRYLKSKTTAVKQVGQHRFSLSFQSGRYNWAGQRVTLYVHARVENEDFKHWQETSNWPLKADGLILIGQIGNFKMPYEWLSFEVYDPSTDGARVDDVVNDVRRLALSLFDQCLDLDTFAREAAKRVIPGVVETAAVGLCYWRLGPEAAESCLDLLLNVHPARRESYREGRALLASGDNPSQFYDLARVAVSLGIGESL